MVRRFRRITQPNKDIGALDQGPGAFDSDTLDLLVAIAKARSVREQDWNSAERDGNFDMIARGSRC